MEERGRSLNLSVYISGVNPREEGKMMMEVSITHYEDISSPQGDIVTLYMLRVHMKDIAIVANDDSDAFEPVTPPPPQTSGSYTYYLAKRYSDFKALYDNCVELLPGDYKFPNKSLFNNSAVFTKERRIRVSFFSVAVRPEERKNDFRVVCLIFLVLI